MDPKKNFRCVKCGYIINDSNRQYGAKTPCPRCQEEEFNKKYDEEQEGEKYADRN